MTRTYQLSPATANKHVPITHKSKLSIYFPLRVHKSISICTSPSREPTMSSTSVSEYYELRVRQFLQESEQQLEVMARRCEATVIECERFLAQHEATQTTYVAEISGPKRENITGQQGPPSQAARTPREPSRAQGSHPPPASSRREIQPPVQPCEIRSHHRQPFGTSCIQWVRPWSDNGKLAFTGPRHWGANELRTAVIQAPPSQEDHNDAQEPDRDGAYVLVRRRAESDQGRTSSGTRCNEAAGTPTPAPNGEGAVTTVCGDLETVEVVDEVRDMDDDIVAVYYAAE